MDMLARLDIGRGYPNWKPITVNRLAVADISNGNLVAERNLLPDRELAQCFSGCAKRHGDDAIPGDRFKYGCDVVIGLQQDRPSSTYSHVDVASSARANAFVPAS